MVPVPPPAPGPVRVKVTAGMRAEPPGEAAPSLMVILTVWADESVCVSVNTIDSIQWPATKLVQLQYRFLLLEVRKVAELLVEPGTFETIESPLSATVIVPVLVWTVPTSPVKLFGVTVMTAASTPATMPIRPTTTSARAGTFFVVMRLSSTRILVILSSSKKNVAFEALE